jgi:hypothetical protein
MINIYNNKVIIKVIKVINKILTLEKIDVVAFKKWLIRLKEIYQNNENNKILFVVLFPI